MCALNVSEHLNRGRVNNYRTVIKVYNFSVSSVKQYLTLISLSIYQT